MKILVAHKILIAVSHLESGWRIGGACKEYTNSVQKYPENRQAHVQLCVRQIVKDLLSWAL